MPIISIEGNIGCGKEAVLRQLERDGFSVALEPVDQWTSANGVNLLHLGVTQPDLYRHHLNTWVLLTLHNRDRNLDSGLHVVERSLFSNRYVFARVLEPNPDTKPTIEAFIEDHLFQQFLGSYPKVDLFIYLCVPPEVCAERIKKRGRPEEESVSLAYLQNLHGFHQQWLVDGTFGSQTAPVHIVDASLPLTHVVDACKQVINDYLR